MNLYGPQNLIESMRTVRKNMILIAEDIPEESYGYRPTPESRSVAEVLLHRAQLMVVQRLLGIVPHLTRNRQESVRSSRTGGRSSCSVGDSVIDR